MTGTNPADLLRMLQGGKPDASDDPGDSSAATEAEPDRKPTQADRLVNLAIAQKIELFHDPSGQRYARMPVGGHLETWPLNAAGFRDWLSHEYWREYASVPSAQAMQNAIATLGGKALFEGDEHSVYVRIASHEIRLYLDLGDPAWKVIEITADEWRVVGSHDVPVRFRRPKTLLPLPEPTRGGSLAELRPFVNVSDSTDFNLILGWLVGLFQPAGGRAILEIIGEQGTAKTTLARLLRAIIDPCTVPLRGLPRDERDLLIAATNGALVGIDNVTAIKDWLSDALCRLSTGGGISGRQLYTDGDEHAINAQRSALVTGINRVGQRGDLLDRTVTVPLEPIPAGKRRTEATLATAFDAAHPRILGALLDAATTALANHETTVVENPPRLADFVTWVQAASPALGWQPGDFARAFEQTRRDADEAAVEALPIGPAVRALVSGGDASWTGTASELLAALVNLATDEMRRDPDWPKRANSLSRQIQRLAPNLRRLGVRITDTRTKRGRVYTIQKSDEIDRHYRRDRHSEGENPDSDRDIGGDDSPDDDRHPSSPPERVSSPQKPHETGQSDDSDGSDDQIPTHSISADNGNGGKPICTDCGGLAPADGQHWCASCRDKGANP